MLIKIECTVVITIIIFMLYLSKFSERIFDSIRFISSLIRYFDSKKFLYSKTLSFAFVYSSYGE